MIKIRLVFRMETIVMALSYCFFKKSRSKKLVEKKGPKTENRQNCKSWIAVDCLRVVGHPCTH
jgi:hypothetical protein